MNVDPGSDALEISVYTEVNTEAPRPPFVPGGIEVLLSWLHIPDGVGVGDQFRLLFVTHRGRLPTSGDIDVYNRWVNEEAAGKLVRGEERDESHTDPIIRSVAEDEDKRFKAVVCTASVDARTNTGMPDIEIGVPVHWLDGGWEDRPTLVAYSNDGLYAGEWVNTEYGAYVTGNSAYFHESAKVWTGCDASGDPHPTVPMGAITPMDMVAVGTPRDPAANDAPLGAVDVAIGFAYYKYFVKFKGEKQERLLPLYAISPVFTVVD